MTCWGPSTSQPAHVDEDYLRGWPLPSPDAAGDKEHRGSVLVVAGSREMPGAALLTAVAALRAGAGKLTVATARSVASSLAVALPEARVTGLDETPAGGLAASSLHASCIAEARFAALVIGPGMLDEPSSIATAIALCRLHPQAPVLLDALAMGAAPLLGGDARRLVLTPHAGEMAHLLGATKDEVLADPQAAACHFATRYGSHVALKGSTTFIAGPGAQCWCHEGGHVGLATSGSGDVLAGVVAGLLARGAELSQAACWGVALHARAGDRLLMRHGVLGLLAREIAGEVPSLMHQLASSWHGAPRQG